MFNWPQNCERVVSNESTKWIPANNNSSQLFALTVHQSSFNPVIPKNSTILVESQKKPQDGDYVLVSYNKQEPTIKRFFQDENTFYLKHLILPIIPNQLNSEHQILGTLLECRIKYQP